MGLRGPAPKTAEALRASGSWRAGLAEDGPEPKKGRPVKPSWLDEIAKGIWDELVPHLEEMDVLAHCDRQALAMLCETLAEWRRAVKMVHDEGIVVDCPLSSGNGTVKRAHPAVKIASDKARLADKLLQEFGLTPTARTRIHVAAPTPTGSGKDGEDGNGETGKEEYLRIS